MAYNILLVDDSETVRAIISKTLHLAGVETGKILEAANGRDALALLESEWIDLVFADINMPVMGGVEMIDKMHQDGLLKTVPVVIVSTEGSRARIDELMAKGVRAYIRKPFTPEAIRNVIEEVLER